ncbi:L-lactate permease [Fructilactobacillus fructivorans]|uniref:L-lactate permease n=1 Tax=Fructilactobacillus fructivorans TaxID=1614 RepID=UPI00070FC5AE|nr:L-lactate permease [Fructilactobacillus fructivorans]KRN39895.1 L-lactate transport protein [Fructilactobacillus fructivorans]
MELLVSMFPILIPIILLGFLNMPALKGMSVTAILVILASLFIWKMPLKALAASAIQGFHKSLTIAWILLGALLLLRALEYTGSVDRINAGFTKLTTDMRLQTILIVFLFGSLIEGVSGFGAPAMVTAPLLIALGFKPLSSIVLALVADSTAASFGAVGTPLTVGLSNTVGTAETGKVGLKIANLELISGTLVPLILIVMLVFLLPNQHTQNRLKSVLQVTPWCIAIGLVYSISNIGSQLLLGYELTSVISPIIALVIAILSIKFNILLPKDVKKNPWKQSPKITIKEPKTNISLVRAWMPYVLVVVLLVIPKLIRPIHDWLNTHVNLSLTNILGFKAIDSSWLLLASPGTVLLIVALLTVLLREESFRSFSREAWGVVKSMKTTILTLIVTLIMVQVFTNTSFNGANLDSMPGYLASFMATHLHGVWLAIAPILGAVGSFVTGSTTVSTLTFSSVQADVAIDAGLDKYLILAGQVIGAAVGNMICVYNIVSVSGVVGLKGEEGKVMRKTAIPAVAYLFFLIISIFVFK